MISTREIIKWLVNSSKIMDDFMHLIVVADLS